MAILSVSSKTLGRESLSKQETKEQQPSCFKPLELPIKEATQPVLLALCHPWKNWMKSIICDYKHEFSQIKKVYIYCLFAKAVCSKWVIHVGEKRFTWARMSCMWCCALHSCYVPLCFLDLFDGKKILHKYGYYDGIRYHVIYRARICQVKSTQDY